MQALGENGIHDMINMNKLTEDTILRNIQKRFGKNIIYVRHRFGWCFLTLLQTNIGAILVAMNPYQVLPIYTQKAVEACTLRSPVHNRDFLQTLASSSVPCLRTSLLRLMRPFVPWVKCARIRRSLSRAS